jgi:hypothetical protein
MSTQMYSLRSKMIVVVGVRTTSLPVIVENMCNICISKYLYDDINVVS